MLTIASEKITKIKEINYSYKISLIINYLFNQSYILVAFGLKNNFLGFVSCVFTLVSLLFLMYEVYNLKKGCIKYLIPYLLLSLLLLLCCCLSLCVSLCLLGCPNKPCPCLPC